MPLYANRFRKMMCNARKMEKEEDETGEEEEEEEA
jgi:hypothetical protein